MSFYRCVIFIVVLTGLAWPAAGRAGNKPAVPVIERSDDNLVLVQLRLQRLVLQESMPGYLINNHLMLPLSQLAQALEFPITVNAPEGQAEGWFLTPSNHFTLDMGRHEVIVAGNRSTFASALAEVHKDDIYVDTALLSAWWPVDFNFSFSTQSVTVSGKNGALLPAQLEAQRTQAESVLAGKKQEPQGPFPRLDTPYRPYTVPFTDITYTAGMDQEANLGPHNGITALANGDLFYMHSSVYIAADTEQKVTDLRWTLSRRDPDGQLFRPGEWMSNTELGEAMNAHQVKDIEFGDINTQQLPLTAFNQIGRGFMISTMPYDRATNYNRTTLQGNIQPGWEVELYRNDELLEYQRATADGRYSFVDVPLVSGLNILRLVFYGPFGQTRQEIRRFLVTPDLTQQGKSYFRYSFSQQDTSALQIANQNLSTASLSGATPLQTDIIRGKPRSLFEYEYGITNTLSLFANAASLTTPDDISRHYLSTGLATALAGAYGRMDVAHDTTGGGNALEMLLQDNLFGVSLSGDSQLFRQGFISEFTEDVGDPVTSRTTVRADAPLTLPYLPRLNAGVSDSYITYTSGRVVDDVSARLSTAIERVALSHVITYRSDTSPTAVPLAALFPTTTLPVNTSTFTPYNKQTTGELIASFPINHLTLRGDMLYGIEPRRDIQTLISEAQYAFTPDTNMIAQVDRQLVDLTLTTYTITFNRQFGKFLVGASASHSDDGKNALGFTISLAVGENPRTGDVEFYPDNTARDGIIAARAFHDSNGNGVFDDGEDPIPDARFRVNHGGSNDATGQDGAVLLRNIPSDVRTTLTLDGESLENPYLLNNKPGYDVVARAGVPVLVDFPVASSGDVEGTVYEAVKDGSRQEVADVVMQIVTGDGKVVREVRSGFDGYYLFNAIPAGRYSLRVSPEQAKRLGFNPGSARAFLITSSEDISHVLDMEIGR